MRLAHNIAANLGSKVWIAGTNFVAVPFLVRLLGIHSYGLITFFTTLMGIVSLLDLGISTAVNRQLSRDGPDHPASADLARSLEIIYWSVAAFLGLGIYGLAAWLASDWLAVPADQVLEVTRAIRIMAVVVFFRWPVALYSAALLGLQRQVLQNAIAAGAATLQNLGSVLVISLLTPSVATYFICQAIIASLWCVVSRQALWGSFARRPRPPFASLQSLSAIWRFSLGVFAITISSVILTQLDKVVLSRILTLEDFGYYGLASSISNVITVIPTAVYAAALPALSQSFSEGPDEKSLAKRYHSLCQALSVLVMAPALTLVLFSHELLRAYTGDARITERTYQLVSLLGVGNLFLAVMIMPLALQLAGGWTRLSMLKNLFALSVFVPTLLFAAHAFQGRGAAATWILLTAGYFLLEVPFMHRRVLVGEQSRWYLVDVGRPLLATLAVLGVARAVLPADWAPQPQIVFITIAAVLAMVASALTMPRLLATAQEVVARRISL